MRIIKEYLKLTFSKRKKVEPFKNNKFKLISLNLRRDQEELDNWDTRKNKILDFLKQEQPHILCSQEVMPHMYKFLLKEFGFDGYGIDNYLGCKLNLSPLISSEGNIILYDKNKYTKVHSGVFWLSDKPNFPSATWGNKTLRTCVYVALKDKETKKVIYVFNTHFDHISNEAREKSEMLVLKKINEIALGCDVYLTGDFNAPIKDLTKLNAKFDNTYNYNKNLTFNSFKNLTKTLDAVYFRFGNKFNVEIPNIKLSDHTPVIISK